MLININNQSFKRENVITKNDMDFSRLVLLFSNTFNAISKEFDLRYIVRHKHIYYKDVVYDYSKYAMYYYESRHMLPTDQLMCMEVHCNSVSGEIISEYFAFYDKMQLRSSMLDNIGI